MTAPGRGPGSVFERGADEHCRSLRHPGRPPAAGAARAAPCPRQHERRSARCGRSAETRSAPGPSAPMRKTSSPAASSAAAVSSSTRRTRSSMCWSTITRTIPARRFAMRVLRPIVGDGLLVAEGRPWKHQRRTLAPAFTPRAVSTLIPHMVVGDRRDDRQAESREQRAGGFARSDAAHDAGDRRPHHVLVRHGPSWRDAARLRDRIWRSMARPKFLDMVFPLSWPTPQDFARAPLPQALDEIRRHADGRAPCRRQAGGRAAARPVRADGRRARSRDRDRRSRRSSSAMKWRP